MSETDLKEKYSEYYRKGETFAKTNLTTLRRLEAKGLLKTILPIEKLPDPSDGSAIEAIVKHVTHAALNQCQRDLIENNVPDLENNLKAFRQGFTTSFLEQLTRSPQ